MQARRRRHLIFLAALAALAAIAGGVPLYFQYYERALAINPELGAAHLGLGSALASQGKRSEAVSHLERAARSTEAAVRQAAQEALQALQRDRKSP